MVKLERRNATENKKGARWEQVKEKLLLVGMVLLVGLVVGTDYAIVVGIDNYRWLGTLKYAEKDAEEIGAQLRKMGFNTKILTGKVSGEEILGEIQYMSQYTRSTDTLLFYFSGHGAPGDTERTRGLCTYYSDPKTGNFILTQEQLKRELANFGGKKVVVLDACYQGSDVRNLARDNAAMDRKLGEEVDLLVTSSAANQEANDGFYVGNQFIQNGVVGYYLQRALAGEADSDQNGMLTAGELSGYFLGYAGYMAEQNEQDLQVGYKNRNQPLLVVGESSGSSRVPEGMVLVEKGSFEMGSIGGDSDEEPVHRVELTYDYLIGKYEVTNEEYVKFLNGARVRSDGSYNGHEVIDMDDEDCEISYVNGRFEYESGKGKNPVIEVSWWGALEYCNWKSVEEGLAEAYDGNGNLRRDIADVKGYRLPTEAEWEYAARGGRKSAGDYKFAGSNDLDRVGWYSSNSGSKTHPVGQKAPNELGIYDMSGNVWEWCYDWKGSYGSGSQTNPVGPSQAGSIRVLRGGSWVSYASNCRVADRSNFSPGDSYIHLGLRLSRTY